MKKLFFLLFIAVCMSTTINAQDDESSIVLGAKAGMNISNVYDSEGDEFDASPKMGIAAGVFMQVPIGTFLGIQPEVMFSQKGYKSTGSVLGFDYTMTRTSNYLDIPVFLAIKPSEYVSLLFGPQYSYLFKQTNELVTPISNTVVEEEFDNENIRKNTFGLAMGLDFRFQAFVLSGRLGMDLFNNNGDGSSTTPRYKNVTGQITLGVAL
jgi:Outer membrane protein beta-barrel domain